MRKYLLFTSLIFAFSCQSSPEEAKPARNDITESVYASVTITPEVSYFPFTSKAGLIEEIFVEEGDTVEKGQVLFRIATSQSDNRLIDAQLDFSQTKANLEGSESLLRTLQLDIQNQRQKLTFDSLTFKRQENLWNQKVGTAIDYDRAKVTYQTSRNSYKTLLEKYEQTEVSLRNSLEKAANRVNSERTAIKEYIVKSKIDGQVYNIFKESGELLSQQEAFADIGSVNQFKINMDIDEIDITKINVGDNVVISLDAYPNDVFEAKITKIFPKKEASTQTFKVESHFVKVPPKLYNGLAGEANIIIATRKNVLTIPTDYLQPDNIVITEEGEVSVKTGVKNLEFVEIISGLDTNTTLQKPTK